MRSVTQFRFVLAMLSGIALVVAPAAAQSPEISAGEEVTATPWQDVVSSQIQAFRDHDAPTAFSYAGAGFQVTFQNAEVFFEAIVNSGYAPIMESRSHSFGDFQRLGGVGVIQEVRLVGEGQELYTAIYQLTEEEVGWRVQSVQLVRKAGVAI